MNIEISGISYDALLAGKYKTTTSGKSGDEDGEEEVFEVYEPLDYKAQDQLARCVSTFEDELKEYIQLRKTMPSHIQDSFRHKLDTIRGQMELGEDGVDAEEALLEKYEQFEKTFQENFDQPLQTHQASIQSLSTELSKYSHLERVLQIYVSFGARD